VHEIYEGIMVAISKPETHSSNRPDLRRRPRCGRPAPPGDWAWRLSSDRDENAQIPHSCSGEGKGTEKHYWAPCTRSTCLWQSRPAPSPSRPAPSPSRPAPGSLARRPHAAPGFPAARRPSPTDPAASARRPAASLPGHAPQASAGGARSRPRGGGYSEFRPQDYGFRERQIKSAFPRNSAFLPPGADGRRAGRGSCG
jgi:hypothetical protein